MRTVGQVREAAKKGGLGRFIKDHQGRDIFVWDRTRLSILLFKREDIPDQPTLVDIVADLKKASDDLCARLLRLTNRLPVKAGVISWWPGMAPSKDFKGSSK